MDFLQNITFRRTRTHSDSNINIMTELSKSNVSNTFDEETQNDISQSSLYSLNSLSKQHQNEQVIVLQERIQKLEIELSCAHKKIESLSLENTNLKRSNEALTRYGNVHNTITSSSIKETNISRSTPTKTRPKRNKLTQPDKFKLTHSSSSNKQTHTTSQIQQNKTCKQQILKKTTTQRKICILSNNYSNNITLIGGKVFGDTYGTCHYLKTHCNTHHMLHDIQSKLQHFTMDDFCIILIGEEDFKTTNDYFNLIFYIRENLQEITHTNVILCTPTYKYGHYHNLYNSRIENFNNLLYLDILAHEHAYFLDSNKNLSCDFKMFHTSTGKLNNYGMRTIFIDIFNLICNIQNYDNNNDDNILYDDNSNELQHNESLQINEFFL